MYSRATFGTGWSPTCPERTEYQSRSTWSADETHQRSYPLGRGPPGLHPPPRWNRHRLPRPVRSVEKLAQGLVFKAWGLGIVGL